MPYAFYFSKPSMVTDNVTDKAHTTFLKSSHRNSLNTSDQKNSSTCSNQSNPIDCSTFSHENSNVNVSHKSESYTSCSNNETGPNNLFSQACEDNKTPCHSSLGKIVTSKSLIPTTSIPIPSASTFREPNWSFSSNCTHSSVNNIQTSSSPTPNKPNLHAPPSPTSPSIPIPPLISTSTSPTLSTSPSLDYWNKTHYRSFSVTKQRQQQRGRRRSSLCYSQSLDYDDACTPLQAPAESEFETRPTTQNHLSQFNKMKPNNSIINGNFNSTGNNDNTTTNANHPFQRPSFTLCESCKENVEVPFQTTSSCSPFDPVPAVTTPQRQIIPSSSPSSTLFPTPKTTLNTASHFRRSFSISSPLSSPVCPSLWNNNSTNSNINHDDNIVNNPTHPKTLPSHGISSSDQKNHSSVYSLSMPSSAHTSIQKASYSLPSSGPLSEFSPTSTFTTFSLHSAFSPSSTAVPFRSCSRSYSHSALLSNKEPLVGSYEESLLSGRMSAPCSPPVAFYLKLCAIGVSSESKAEEEEEKDEEEEKSIDEVAQGNIKGKGEKSDGKEDIDMTEPSVDKKRLGYLLKMPQQVSAQFDAVFYDYELHQTGIPGKGSPYVGCIDLEKLFVQKNVEKENKKKEKGKEDGFDGLPDASLNDRNGVNNRVNSGVKARCFVDKNDSKDKKKKRTGDKSRSFPGYRIPPKGTIQIVISNPQKTAVRLFLIPYDVSDLEYKQKTFLRYKVFEKGDQEKDEGDDTEACEEDKPTDSSEAKSNTKLGVNSGAKKVPAKRGQLVQAAHLRIARPSKNKFYLYGDLRLVFHNREDSNVSGLMDSAKNGKGAERREGKNFGLTGYSKMRNNVVVSMVNGGKSRFKYDIEAAYRRVSEECQEIEAKEEQEDAIKESGYFSKTVNYRNPSFLDSSSDLTNLASMGNLSGLNMPTKHSSYSNSDGPNSFHNSFTSAKICELCKTEVVETLKNTTTTATTATSNTDNLDDSIEDIEMIDDSRQELDKRLRKDLNAVSLKSFENAPGIV